MGSRLANLSSQEDYQRAIFKGSKNCKFLPDSAQELPGGFPESMFKGKIGNIKHSPHWLGWRGGEDKNAQRKAAGARWCVNFFMFSKMLVELSQMLEVWSEKCVSGVIFWRAWGSKKRGFDCISTVFYCFQLNSTFFDIKHAKCDLTVKNKWKMRLGWILARAAFGQN